MNNKAITVTTRIATACATGVILAAGALSYTALYDLFVSIGLFAAWLGLLFPLLFDLAEVTAAVSVLNARLQGDEDRFAWSMVIVFTVLGIVANIGHAAYAFYTDRIDAAQLALAIFATSLFPLSVALVTHLLKRVITRSLERHDVTASLAELRAESDRLTRQIEQKQKALEALDSAISDRQIQVKRASIADMQAAREAKMEERRQQVLTLFTQDMTQAEMAETLDVSESTIARDIKALRELGALNGREH